MATLPYERDILNIVFCHHLSEVEKLPLFFTENSSPLISRDRSCITLFEKCVYTHCMKLFWSVKSQEYDGILTACHTISVLVHAPFTCFIPFRHTLMSAIRRVRYHSHFITISKKSSGTMKGKKILIRWEKCLQ
jgi:hypothetical protein